MAGVRNASERCLSVEEPFAADINYLFNDIQEVEEEEKRLS